VSPGALPPFVPGQYDEPMSFSETIFLFFLALIIFGPKKLPEIARTIGKYLNEFRRASNEFKAQIEQEIAQLEVDQKKQTELPSGRRVEGTAGRTLHGGTFQGGAVENGASDPTAGAASASAAAPPESLPEPSASQPAVASNGSSSASAVTSSTTQESHA
jgi:TatA/E family protein of Tat protein translocase